MAASATRSASRRYGEMLVGLGRDHPDLIVLDAGLGTSMETAGFQAAYPDRYINLGIAEQNAVGVASGLAREGFVPILHSFANFLARRARDQIAVSVAWPGVPVKLVVGSCGLWDGRNGASHTGNDDLAGIVNMPGMLVAEPADQAQTRQLLADLIAYPGPAYMRLRRHGMPRDIAGQPLDDGSVLVHQASGRPACTLVAIGTMLAEALYAARLLGDGGTEVDLIGVSVLTPASLGPVIESVGRSGLAVVIENHAPHGGFADSIAAALSPLGVAMHRFTLPREFLPAADPTWLLAHCSLSGPQIAARIDDVLARPSEVQ